MHGDIDKLIQYIAAHFVFDDETYSSLKDLSDRDRLIFAINHLALHFAKTAGKVATVSERVDHGEELNSEELKANVSKAFINTLRLAELVGMTEQDLIKTIEKKYGDMIG